MKARPGLLVVAGLVAGLVAGYGLGRSAGESTAAYTTFYLHSVERAGSSAMTLALLREANLEKLETLHATLLRTNVDSAYSMIERVERLDSPLPNLVEAANRTAALAESDPRYADLEERSERVRDHLAALSENAP